jgi:hypothetical protein
MEFLPRIRKKMAKATIRKLTTVPTNIPSLKAPPPPLTRRKEPA